MKSPPIWPFDFAGDSQRYLSRACLSRIKPEQGSLNCSKLLPAVIFVASACQDLIRVFAGRAGRWHGLEAQDSCEVEI